MPSVLLIDREFDQLDSIPHSLRALYVALRRRMDGATRMVGSPHPCSWQALREDVYVQPRPGIAGFSPSRFTLLRMAQGLERAGLVQLRSNALQHQLLMLLPLAPTLGPKKAAPNPHQKPHVPFHRGDPQKAARGEGPKAAPHLSSILPTVAALNGGDLATRGRAKKPTWLASYPQAYPQTERDAILEVAYEKHLDADAVQLALDELSGIEKKALVRNRPALFFTIAKQMKAGTFFGNQAAEERSYGTPLSPEELQFQNEGGNAL